MTIAEGTLTDLLTDVRRVASERLAPIAHAGTDGRVNRDLLRALSTEGVLGMLFPGHGTDGAQTTAETICLLREALAYGCVEAEVALAMQGIGGYPVLQSGQRHHLDRWLGPLREGTAVAAFALTEPDAGSGAAALRLEAVADGDGWRLHGTKMWTTNAPDADFYTTFARTTQGAGARGVTAFLVPADSPGLKATSVELFAPHPIGRLDFDSVRVTRADVLGEVDRGFRVAMKTFDLFRPSVGAAAVGMAQAALDAAVRHTSQRQAFGQALGRQQAVAHALSDAATKLEASRLLVRAAAAAHDSGDGRVTAKSAMAKLFATESAQQVIDTAFQFHGASGLRAGHLLEGLYREIRASRIFEGASEIQRDIIARDLYRDTPIGRRAGGTAKAAELSATGAN
ncbi:acyl-CoA dehydrogenase family protein [Streptomyces sp. GbtcB7]|uniref:acyl-CoA dehydrogenase family protein n=1 Tax=Streptomyces sp. GbtcB7 TaxID=2824752 RepID=UPI001C2F2DB5|nr:acyl-CoA dehydrogenase family protein [Streptomyces sp. GbtcB7]